MVNPRTGHSESLSAWLRTGLGQSLVEAEARCLAPLLGGCFGPVAVQVESAGIQSFLDLSDAVFCYTAADAPGNGGAPHLICGAEALPFESRSVGLVVLPHVLEFSDHPHQVLREAERVLMPEGHLLVLGFNPFSVWGAVRVFQRRRMPWQGRFSSLNRVKDWLQLLNFELIAGSMIYHKPPVHSERLRRRLEFLERAGDRWWPLGAAVFAVLARKRVIGLTPLQPSWKRRNKSRPGLVRPVAGARRCRHDTIDAG